MIRTTAEQGPTLPEQLVFSTGEAEISVTALAYYVTSDLKTREDNWDVEGLNAMTNPRQSVMEGINRVSRFVNFYQDLAEKFSGVVDNPEQATELSPQEIEALGFSLFRLGNSGLAHARNAIKGGRVGFKDTAAQEEIETTVQQTADDAYELFKKLEPISTLKSGISWMIWNRKPSDARPA